MSTSTLSDHEEATVEGVLKTFWQYAKYLGDVPMDVPCPLPQLNFWNLSRKIATINRWPLAWRVKKLDDSYIKLFSIQEETQSLMRTITIGSSYMIVISVMLESRLFGYTEFTLLELKEQVVDLELLKVKFLLMGNTKNFYMWVPISSSLSERLDPRRHFQQQALKHMRRLILMLDTSNTNALLGHMGSGNHASFLALCAGGDLRGDKAWLKEVRSKLGS